MKRICCLLAALLLLSERASGTPPIPPDASALILTLQLPDPTQQDAPYPLFASPENGLMMEFPAPILTVAGRGFRVVRGEVDADETDAEWTAVPHRVPKSATSVEDIPGPYTLYITPLVAKTQRLLHIVLSDGRLYTFLCSTPPLPEKGRDGKMGATIAHARIRWRGGMVANTQAPAPVSTPTTVAPVSAPSFRPSREALPDDVKRVSAMPNAALREPTPETSSGMLDFLRLLASLPRDRAIATASSNPVYQTMEPASVEEDNFGDTHGITVLFQSRDTTSNVIGLAVRVRNRSYQKLTLDVSSWKVRIGRTLYRATRVRCPSVLAPGHSVDAQIVIERDAAGHLLDLDVANQFQPSVAVVARESAKPVQSFDLK